MEFKILCTVRPYYENEERNVICNSYYNTVGLRDLGLIRESFKKEIPLELIQSEIEKIILKNYEIIFTEEEAWELGNFFENESIVQVDLPALYLNEFIFRIAKVKKVGKKNVYFIQEYLDEIKAKKTIVEKVQKKEKF